MHSVWLLALPFYFASSEHPIDAALVRCLDTPENQSTHGQIGCFAAAGEQWDKHLNMVWGDLLDNLPSQTHPPLRSAQREWLKFRDAEFKAISATYGTMDGTMYRISAAAAMARIVGDRVKQLENLRDAYVEP